MPPPLSANGRQESQGLARPRGRVRARCGLRRARSTVGFIPEDDPPVGSTGGYRNNAAPCGGGSLSFGILSDNLGVPEGVVHHLFGFWGLRAPGLNTSAYGWSAGRGLRPRRMPSHAGYSTSWASKLPTKFYSELCMISCLPFPFRRDASHRDRVLIGFAERRVGSLPRGQIRRFAKAIKTRHAV